MLTEETKMRIAAFAEDVIYKSESEFFQRLARLHHLALQDQPTRIELQMIEDTVNTSPMDESHSSMPT